MAEEKKDFKEVKVKISGAYKEHTETLDRSMLYSGVNIFGTLTNLYMSSKEQFQSAGISAGNSAPQGLSGASGNSMMSLGNEVLSIFKRMQKRDNVTKIKACQELKKYVEAVEPESDELPNLLTFFLYHMCRILLNENDKIVRESAHDAFTSFIRKGKRKLGPHIKKIFPLWYCAFFDPSPEVVRIARQNFDLAFPIDKQPEVFQLSFKIFLHFCSEQLQQTEDQSAGKEEKKLNEQNYDRVTGTVLQALANSFQFVKKWSVDQQENYHKKFVKIFELNEIEQQQQVKGKKVQKKEILLWSFLQNKYKGSIKGSCLQFISAFITEMPQEIVSLHIKELTPAIFNLVSEQNTILQTTFWREALFTLCKNYPKCWEHISIKKDFLPKLYKCLKDAAFGAPTPLYENFIKYLSVCPLYKLTEESDDKNNKASFKDKCNQLREVMLNLYTAFQSDEVIAFHTDLVNSYFESLTFILLKRIQPIKSDIDLEFAMKQMEKVIQMPLLDFMSNYQKSQSKFQKQRTLRSTFQQKYANFLFDLSKREFSLVLFKQVCDIIAVELDPSNRCAMRVMSQIIMQSGKMPQEYMDIVESQIISATFNKQSESITNFITNLSKNNIAEALQMSKCHSRLVYTILKKVAKVDATKYNLIPVGTMLTKILKIEKMAIKALSNENQIMFKDLEQCIVDISVLYLSQKFEISEEFSKILLALGLLEVSTDENVQMSPLEETLFKPDFPKLKLEAYYQKLRDSDTIHDLMIGALSIKMLAENAVVAYKGLVQKVINDSVFKSSDGLLNEDDIELIRTHVISQLMEPDLNQNSISAYFQTVQALCIQNDSQNDEFREILLQKILDIKITQKGFDSLWDVFEASVKDNLKYQDIVTQKLAIFVHQLINSKANEIAQFNHVTKVINLFVQTNSNKIETLAQILLKENNFKLLDQNCLPIKVFKDLFLTGGVGFDVQQLLSTKINDKYVFVWLASMFLTIKHLASISSFMELRRQLMIFVETEVYPAIVNLGQTDSHFVVEVFDYLCQHGKLYTLEHLAKMMIDPGEQYPSDLKPVLKIDDFKEVYNITVKDCANKLIETNFTSKQIKEEFLVVILQTIGYQIFDEPSIKQIFNIVKTNLLQTEDYSKVTKTQLEIYMALEKWFGVNQSEFQITLLNGLLKVDSIDIKQISIILCNNLLEQESVTVIKEKVNKNDLLMTILELLQYTGDVACQNTITLCKVIRKTLTWNAAADSIISVLIQATKDRALHFDSAIKSLKTANVVRPFEIEMLQELAETLLVCPSTLSEFTLNPSIEENLYFLLGCGYQALQKASYVLLKYIYDNFIPPVQFQSNDEDDLKQLMNRQEESKDQVHSTAFKNIPPTLLKLIDEAPAIDEEENIQENDLESLVYGTQEEGQMNNKTFGYLLAWNSMLNKIEQGRIKAQLQAETQQSQNAIQYLQVLAALTELLETDNMTYHMMLVSLVHYLPKINKKGIQESYGQEVALFSPEYCDPRNSKHTKLFCLMSLINFMKSFPSLGRKFYQECDKMILEVMLPYIKSVISPAILDNEIKKIELSQLELGQNSDLTFVLFKSTKEVVATYKKQAELSCQLKIRIPHDYPLKSVVVDIGEQLKLKQTQIRKWTLSIRNLLQSRNGDIISAILLWKNNIDKEMQGIEECTICYSVLHASDKSLPSMQCRNCKNKFHVACIRKWFNTSNKSNCPLCQTFFFQ